MRKNSKDMNMKSISFILLKKYVHVVKSMEMCVSVNAVMH